VIGCTPHNPQRPPNKPLQVARLLGVACSGLLLGHGLVLVHLPLTHKICLGMALASLQCYVLKMQSPMRML
jgi:hypothetical protein